MSAAINTASVSLIINEDVEISSAIQL